MMLIKLLSLIFIVITVPNVYAFDRCKKYYAFVSLHAKYYFGIDAPVHYFMGQMEQESRCNEGITAFDGGQGLFQIMPNTEREIERDWMQEFNPYDVFWNIKAGIYYDYKMRKDCICKDWYYVFRAYNGGVGRLNNEIKRAGGTCCSKEKVEMACNRGGVWYKGKYIDFCKVNISYPYNIFERSKKYVKFNFKNY